MSAKHPTAKLLRNRYGLLIAFAGLAVVVVSGVWLADSPPALQKLTLPDGSELSVRKVTYGRKHEMAYGLGWNDRIFRVLPPHLAPKLGATVAAHNTTQTNGIVIWLERKNEPSVSRPKSGASAPAPRLRVTVVDEKGIESEEDYPVFEGGGSFWGFQLLNYPWRSREITVRTSVLGTRGYSRVGEFRIKNPWPSQSPVWVPEPLPVTRNTNGLEISLLTLEVHPADPLHSWWDMNKNSAIFKLREKDMPATNWSIARITGRAATGEIFDPKSYAWDRDRGGLDEFNFHFQAGFWSEEPAWKILVEAERTAGFPADELWTIKSIRIPGPQQVVEVNCKTNMHGTEVELLGVAAPGATPPRSWRNGGFGDTRLYVRLAATAEPLHVELVDVVDNLGRKLELGGNAFPGYAPSELIYAFRLEVPDDAKSIDVTVAVSKGRTVEFLVKPKVVK